MHLIQEVGSKEQWVQMGRGWGRKGKGQGQIGRGWGQMGRGWGQGQMLGRGWGPDQSEVHMEELQLEGGPLLVA